MSESTSDLAPHLCRMCREPVTPGARVCTTCGASQTLWGQIALAMKWVGAAATIVSLLIGMTSLYGLYNAQLNTQATIAELGDAADLLRDEGDYRRAWQLYDDAAALDASAPRVRRGREQLALLWLPRASISGDEQFGTLVDQMLPVLLRGYQHATGTRAADFLALSGWAHFLERRERPFSTVDIPATYQAALAIDADNTFAHMFLGHWRISEQDDLDGGAQHFVAAIASARETELARTYHASALMNMLHTYSSDSEKTEAVYRHLLQLLHTMLNNNESLQQTFRNRERTLYETLNAYSKMTFDVVLPALAPEQHRALIRALVAQFDNKDSLAVLGGRMFLARLDEHEGDTAAALVAVRVLDGQVGRNSQLRSVVDAALERLSGEKTNIALEREDPLAFHSVSLQTSDLTSERFRRALPYFSVLAADALEDVNTDKLPAAINAMRAGVARLLSAEGNAGKRYTAAALSLGALQMIQRHLDDAIATYTSIKQPNDTYLRQQLHYNLACVYSLRAGTQTSADAKTDIDTAANHFKNAIDAGYTAWDSIKRDEDLASLRSHATYQRIMAGR